MKFAFFLPIAALLVAPIGASMSQGLRRKLEDSEVSDMAPVPENADSADVRQGGVCDESGMSAFPYQGKDNSERLLLREGLIEEIPGTRCGHNASKNVILVIGDGMGWEMTRAGAIAKRVVDELEELGCDTKTGCPDNTAAMEAFAGRTLDDYYTEGKGSGLSFQELEGFALVTTSTVLLQSPNDGNHYGPANSLLNGTVGDHDNGMAPLALNECGFPIDFNPTDYTEGGNMVMWSDEKGGKYPWDPRYFDEDTEVSVARQSDGFDPTFIMQHATDSANTAGTLATGHKAAVNMLSVDLYEEHVSTLVEDAMECGKAGGVVTSVQMLHATPGAFVTHSNSRTNKDQLQRTFRRVNPSFASGVCSSGYWPEQDFDSMRNGSMSSQWTVFEQKRNVSREAFYDGLENLDPDDGDHVIVCAGGDFSPSGEGNMPFRGVDSTYSNRWCSVGVIETDISDGEEAEEIPVGVTPNSTTCNHYEPEEIEEIPVMKDQVKAALDFLSKDDDGFFLMYEQGDIDWAAHANHMDDMLGAMLDIDEGVREIMNFIEANGGWEKNALYVTADHDHYLTLLSNFPELLAKLIINGESHNITPESNSNVNPWNVAIDAGRHEDESKTQAEHIEDFTTWSADDVANVGHFWGVRDSGGNAWGSHSTRPVGLWHQGDDGCIDALMGAGYRVVGRDVEGIPEKIDQMHMHACMYKNLFGLQ